MKQIQKSNNAPWYVAAAIIIAVIIVASGLTYQYILPSNSGPSPSTSPSASGTQPASNLTIAIYAGEVNPSLYGFGNTSSSITSPGPTFTVKVGTTVTIDFTNSGTMGHNWALVTQKTSGNTYLAFTNAQIASSSNPVAQNGKASSTFVANQAGTYYYICQVDAHVSLGMWGYFVVTR